LPVHRFERVAEEPQQRQAPHGSERHRPARTEVCGGDCARLEDLPGGVVRLAVDRLLVFGYRFS
jgi:hypothetical protein